MRPLLIHAPIIFWLSGNEVNVGRSHRKTMTCGVTVMDDAGLKVPAVWLCTVNLNLICHEPSIVTWISADKKQAYNFNIHHPVHKDTFLQRSSRAFADRTCWRLIKRPDGLAVRFIVSLSKPLYLTPVQTWLGGVKEIGIASKKHLPIQASGKRCRITYWPNRIEVKKEKRKAKFPRR